jgi:hypothetical protein
MKKFVSENWYKLMIGSSLLMASFGFMVHSITPVKAENNNFDYKIRNSKLELMSDEAYYFVDGGYMYRCKNPGDWFKWGTQFSDQPTKRKLP